MWDFSAPEAYAALAETYREDDREERKIEAGREGERECGG
jgi:hypothetical protein